MAGSFLNSSLKTPLLDTIKSPEDLRQLSLEQLDILSREIRETIIKTVAETGGHLGPCLGVVELTIALHFAFDTPEDKIIWDVGHQTYAHKLLTGRKDRFHTLRQYKGLSGFPKREESPYDVVETGHSSTSISYGLGMATANSLQNDRSKVVSVIGDGSMTAGMAFEGLNQTGHMDKDLIVILNDNEMSISPNVGAMSSFLSRKMTSKTIRRLRDSIEESLLALSSVGENILNVLRKSEENLKNLLTPGMLFEALKFKYIGPIPGHKLEDLIETFTNVKNNSHGPVLIHVLTTKGKGYAPAEDKPYKYHGVAPFDIDSGKPQKKENCNQEPEPPTYTEVFGTTICQLARENEKITAITAAMPAGTGLTEFSREFPGRFFDVGIAEQHAVTFAAGLALSGMKPVVAIYSTFMQRALDQIIHDVCLPNLPVTFMLDRAGVVGDDGPTHHGVFDISFLSFIPNLVLMAPKDEQELAAMIIAAMQHDGPVAIRYPRGKGVGLAITDKAAEIKIGQAELLREGQDILFLPVGNRVLPALQAAEELAKDNISVAVINPRFINQLDKELITKWAKKTGKVITIEDNAKKSGFGANVNQLLVGSDVLIPIKNLGYPDIFVEQGPQEILWQNYGIDKSGIMEAALKMYRKV